MVALDCTQVPSPIEKARCYDRVPRRPFLDKFVSEIAKSIVFPKSNWKGVPLAIRAASIGEGLLDKRTEGINNKNKVLVVRKG